MLTEIKVVTQSLTPWIIYAEIKKITHENKQRKMDYKWEYNLKIFFLNLEVYMEFNLTGSF